MRQGLEVPRISSVHLHEWMQASVMHVEGAGAPSRFNVDLAFGLATRIRQMDVAIPRQRAAIVAANNRHVWRCDFFHTPDFTDAERRDMDSGAWDYEAERWGLTSSAAFLAIRRVVTSVEKFPSFVSSLL